MRAWLTIALRNLLKNRRRSAATLAAIALGYAALNLFGGFTAYMYTGNREVAIYALCRGHLTVTRPGFWEQGQLKPERYLLSPEQIAAIGDIVRRLPGVVLVTPQLRVRGLVSNGRISTIFLAQGVVPSSVERFFERSRLSRMIRYRGRALADDEPYGVAMAAGLARLLGVSVDDWAVALATTVDGQMNALDMEVRQIFDSGSDDLDDKVMRVPFAFARQLYDTPGADRLVILLEDHRLTDGVRGRLQDALEGAGLPLEVRTWYELSDWYRQVKQMFDVIFVFLFALVLVIVVMSVINTMSMTVYERIREIGTLRALGLTRRGVVRLFALEAGLLGVGGVAGGLVLTVAGWLAVALFEPTWVPPGVSQRVPLEIEPAVGTMLWGAASLLALCVLACLVPVRRAARRNIIDALAHV